MTETCRHPGDRVLDEEEHARRVVLIPTSILKVLFAGFVPVQSVARVPGALREELPGCYGIRLFSNSRSVVLPATARWTVKALPAPESQRAGDG
jgi:hypothetical protein